ncbi:chemotaxis protein CheX [Bdellovibrionota bacterium FG-2]
MPFEVTTQTDYLVVTLKGDCNGDGADKLAPAADKQLLAGALKYIVVQCSECGDIDPTFMRVLAMLYKRGKELNGKLCLVHANDRIQEAIKRSGLDRILPCKMSLRGALVEFGLVKAKEFDVNFINPFLAATQKVLKVQCFLETTAQKPFIKKPTDPPLFGDISGIIGLTAETFNGTLAISFPGPLFLVLASNMFGQPYKEITNEIVDLAGELSNMILGQAKMVLNPLGYQIQQAIPSCVWGKDHKIKHFGGGACVVMPFETKAGVFHVEVISNSGVQEKKPMAVPPASGGPAAPAAPAAPATPSSGKAA